MMMRDVPSMTRSSMASQQGSPDDDAGVPSIVPISGLLLQFGEIVAQLSKKEFSKKESIRTPLGHLTPGTQ
jgi:hypothetical protein